MGSLLITGASGFAGQVLLRALDPSRHPSVICLCHAQRPEACPSSAASVRHVPGDLANPSSYESILREVETVVHLAAVTGKAKRDAYFRVNAEGTRALLERCRAAGVKRFLFVSTIAVKFPFVKRYFYAQSKQQAEEAVRGSGMRYTIVRPTILVGRNAPVLAGMTKLADLPVVPVFGDGRTPVQPVDVRDLVGFLLALVEKDAFEGETIEFGGPDVLSMEDFLRKLCRMRKGHEARVLHVPLGPVVAMLSLLEPALDSRLPVTVGQLSSFRFDGTAAAHARAQQLWPQRKPVDQMLTDAFA